MTKFRMEIGKAEFEYEGDAEFTSESLKNLLTHLGTLSSEAAEDEYANDESRTPEAPSKFAHDGGTILHTNSVASKLGGKTGTDLAPAAAAHLQIIQRKTTFTRRELLEDMRSATAHYKQTMSANLTRIIRQLINDHTFHQNGTNTYSLSDSARREAEKQLA